MTSTIFLKKVLTICLSLFTMNKVPEFQVLKKRVEYFLGGLQLLRATHSCCQFVALLMARHKNAWKKVGIFSIIGGSPQIMVEMIVILSGSFSSRPK